MGQQKSSMAGYYDCSAISDCIDMADKAKSKATLKMRKSREFRKKLDSRHKLLFPSSSWTRDEKRVHSMQKSSMVGLYTSCMYQ